MLATRLPSHCAVGLFLLFLQNILLLTSDSRLFDPPAPEVWPPQPRWRWRSDNRSILCPVVNSLDHLFPITVQRGVEPGPSTSTLRSGERVCPSIISAFAGPSTEEEEIASEIEIDRNIG